MWLVFTKAHTGKRTFGYVDAVEEAICFGWIDTTVRRIDEGSFMQRFTPRSNERNWSAVNLERFARMEAEGKMTDAGRAKRPADVAPPPPRAAQSGDPLPAEVEKGLAGHAKARRFLVEMAPSYRRDIVRYLMEAKRPETRQRRLEEVIRRLEAGQKRWIGSGDPIP